MIEKITIKNFKSVSDASFSVGNVNVFIGEGCTGKTNLLEALGMAAAEYSGWIELSNMLLKGVRVVNSGLMTGSFSRKAKSDVIRVEIGGSGRSRIRYKIRFPESGDIYSSWMAEVERGNSDTAIRKAQSLHSFLSEYVIYSPSSDVIRGWRARSPRYPLGVNGERFDQFFGGLSEEESARVKEYAGKYMPWLGDIFFDVDPMYAAQGYKLQRSSSNLYFKDKLMRKENNLFAAGTAGDGVLELLFCLAMFISNENRFFGIDNMGSKLTPGLCPELMADLCKLAVEKQKQVLITTHNPAILDGLDLTDDKQRLYIVSRNDRGETKVKRVSEYAYGGERRMSLSEMWIKGLLTAAC